MQSCTSRIVLSMMTNVEVSRCHLAYQSLAVCVSPSEGSLSMSIPYFALPCGSKSEMNTLHYFFDMGGPTSRNLRLSSGDDGQLYTPSTGDPGELRRPLVATSGNQ